MIELKGVNVTYPGGTRALKSTNLRFEGGQFVVLLGASGAGKSTLLRCLNHLTPPTGGSITVDGIGTLQGRNRLLTHRRQTGMIFQQHQLIGRRSVLQNVLTGRLGYHSTLRSFWPLSDHDRSVALACIERVGLLEKSLARVDSLSGGQQQRVGIARAMAQEPRLLLADEPVASLDPESSHRVLSLIRDVCAEKRIPAIVSLHQVELARTFADRIVGIAGGSVVFDDVAGNLSSSELDRLYRQASAPLPEAETQGHTRPFTPVVPQPLENQI